MKMKSKDAKRNRIAACSRMFFTITIAPLLLIACTKNDDMPTNVPSITTVSSISNGQEEPIAKPTTLFRLTEQQFQEIQKMVEDSGVYDEYTPDYDSLTVGYSRNYISIVAQPKDIDTLMISRFQDDRFETKNLLVYFLQRFYDETDEFTYLKNNVEKKAKLGIRYHINQDRNLRVDWRDRFIEGHLYVPIEGANYSFFYDELDKIMFVENAQGEREQINFTEDLEKKMLEMFEAKIRKYKQIDQKAQQLARKIIEYVDVLESKKE